MTTQNPVLKLALQVAKTYADNHEAVVPVSTSLLGDILRHIESLEAQLEWHISDQNDEVKEILLEISGVTAQADEHWFRSRDADWWIVRLRKLIEDHS